MSGPNVEDYTPGWTPAGTNRWRMTDEVGVMHLLIKAVRPATSQADEEARFYELHGLTLHVYRGPFHVTNARWPLGDPTTFDPNAEPVYSHVATSDVSSSALTLYTDESDVWAWLERYASNDGAS